MKLHCGFQTVTRRTHKIVHRTRLFRIIQLSFLIGSSRIFPECLQVYTSRILVRISQSRPQKPQSPTLPRSSHVGGRKRAKTSWGGDVRSVRRQRPCWQWRFSRDKSPARRGPKSSRPRPARETRRPCQTRRDDQSPPSRCCVCVCYYELFVFGAHGEGVDMCEQGGAVCRGVSGEWVRYSR